MTHGTRTTTLLLLLIATALGTLVSKHDAYVACVVDSACATAFSLGSGGTEDSFWLRVTLAGVPQTPSDLLATFDALPPDVRGTALLVDDLIRIGQDTPRCPYDMVYVPDGVGGHGSCTCPLGIDCRPACTATDYWTWLCLACIFVALLLFLARTVLTVPTDASATAYTKTP